MDARTDLYAAGACLYELATGKKPYGDKRGPQLTEAILHEAPAPPGGQNGPVSPGLQAVILKALDKDPDLRYQTAKELLVDLERMQAGATSGSASQSVAGVVGRRQRWTWLAAAAVTTVVALAAGAWLSWPSPPPRITSIRPVTRGLAPIRTHNPTLTTDGPRIYYTAVKDGDWAVFQIPAGGGQPEQIPLPSVADLDGTAARTIARVPSGSRGLRWSPDGTRLRFNGRGPQGHESEFWKWEATVDGGAVEPLWEGEGGNWTPDGRFFVFVRRTSGRSPADLYVARESRRWGRRRASVTRLTFGPHAFSGPLPSLDGRRIFAFGEEPRAELMRWQVARERFVPFLGGSSTGMVDASSDGRWLAWVSFPDGILWRSRRDGSERLQLTSGSAYAYLPRWSPDGTRIAYAAEGQGDSRHSIRVISMTGGAEAIVASPTAADHSYWDPCWLPDGRTILFSNLVDIQPPGIHRVDVDTLQRDLLPGSEYLKYPKCGRQGQVLAQQVGRFGEPAPADGYGFKVLWPDRSTWESIGDLALNYPSWSRDGRFLYGLNLQARRVQRLALDDRQLEDVAAVGFPLANWVFNPWFGIDVDDTPMLMADRGTYEIYALDWDAP